jgi:DNA polymerase-3 subunit delta'
MFFKDVIGQEFLKEKLIKSVKENRISHAWLFFGTEGVGALPLAIAYAQYILCTSRSESDSCGNCASCRKNNKYIHPDLHFTFPVNKTRSVDKEILTSEDFMTDWRDFLIQQPYSRLNRWYEFIDLENKQGIINTEESKRLISKINLKPYESDYKIVIIWQPEKMNDQAGNKLLKLLEEPPAMTVFILVSESPDLLLATIRSRCVHIKIPPINDTELGNAIKVKYSLDPAKIKNIVRLASGNFLRALDLINEAEDFSYNFNKFRDLMRLCFKKNLPDLVRFTEELAGLTRERQKAFLDFGLHTIREGLALHFNTDKIVYITDEEKQFSTSFAPFINERNIEYITYELTRAIQDIERNGNGRIIFLDMSLKLAEQIIS